MAEGFVYLMENAGDGTYKIGYTTGSVADRRKQLLTGSSQDLIVVYEFPTKYPSKLEKYLHRMFHSQHRRGEFFALERSQVESFRTLCERMEQTYDLLMKENYFMRKSQKN